MSSTSLRSERGDVPRPPGTLTMRSSWATWSQTARLRRCCPVGPPASVELCCTTHRLKTGIYIYIRDIYSYARSSGFSQNWEFSFSPCKVHPATNQSKKSHTEYVPALLWWSEHHSTRVDGHVLIPTRPTNPAFRLGLLRCGSSGGHQLMQIHAVWCATAPAGREVLEGASTRLQLGSGGVFKGVLKD